MDFMRVFLSLLLLFFMHDFVHQFSEAGNALLSFSHVRDSFRMVFLNFFMSNKIGNIRLSIINEFKINHISYLRGVFEKNSLKSFHCTKHKRIGDFSF
jgi:hypothetical protein